MARGRKRKHRVREPSGRGSRAEEERLNREFAIWQRRHLDLSQAVQLAEAEAAAAAKAKGRQPQPVDISKIVLDPRAGSPLGRMRMSGELTLRQYHTGQQVAETVARFKIVSGLPIERPTRLRLGEATGRSNFEWAGDVVMAARRRYAMMRAVLLRAGAEIERAVMGTCWLDEDGHNPQKVRKGLDILSNLE